MRKGSSLIWEWGWCYVDFFGCERNWDDEGMYVIRLGWMYLLCCIVFVFVDKEGIEGGRDNGKMFILLCEVSVL